MSDNPCGSHGTCVPASGFKYSCGCKPDYEEESGLCVKDNDLELKVALPIVLIFLLFLFIFVIMKKCRDSGQCACASGKSSGDYEMGNNPGYEQKE